jgi:hypothetical protein
MPMRGKFVRPRIPFSWETGKKMPLSNGLDKCLANAKFLVCIRIISSSDAHSILSPQRQKQIKAAKRGAQKDAAKIVRDVFARAEEIRQSSGIAQAENALSSARDGEQAALTALCKLQCATLAEIRLRAEYLATVEAENVTADCVIASLRPA